MSRPRVSLIVVTYDMAREIPRTIETIRSQTGLDDGDLELIVVDNGSPRPFDATLLDGWDGAHSIRLDPAPPSPVQAINIGLDAARAELIGVMIDGARMLSPGLVAGALAASAMSATPVVATLAFHLGHEVQMKAAQQGYDQSAEDELLGTVDWREDGYELFSISVLAGSSSRGWFGPMGESNAVFMKRGEWDRLGGYDPRFTRPGGGLSNHDLYRRACELDDADLFVLLGEGTFHQYHGGAATSTERDDSLWSEYEVLRGRPYAPPTRQATLVGRVPPQAVPHLEASIAWRSSHR